jgi:hypothetical protein
MAPKADFLGASPVTLARAPWDRGAIPRRASS